MSEKKYKDYYVPTGTASDEFFEKLTNDGSPAIQIRGRNAYNLDGERMCQKHEAAEAVAKLGFPVSRYLCKNSEKKCEYYNTCPYIQQIADAASKSCTRIFSHAHLSLPDDDYPKPEVAIIDESFYDEALDKFELDESVLEKGKSYWEVLFLHSAIKEGLFNEKLLETLEENGISPDMFETCRKLHFLKNTPKARMAPTSEQFNVDPEMSSEEVLGAARKFPGAPKLIRLYTALRWEYEAYLNAKECGQNPRPNSRQFRRIRDSSDQYVIECTIKRSFKRLENVPVKNIDAQADEVLLQAALPARPVTMSAVFAAERNARVVQGQDRTLSNSWVLSQDHPDRVKQLGQFLWRCRLEHGRVLVVTTKPIRKALQKEAGKAPG